MIGVVVVSRSRDVAPSVAGMPLALRNALLLQSVGCEALRVWGEGAEAWCAWIFRDDRVRVPCEVASGALQGPYLSVSDDALLDAATLRALARAPAVLFEGADPVAVHRASGVAAEPLRDAGEGALHGGVNPALRVRSAEEARAASRVLLQRLRKPQDGIVSRALNRRISLAVTSVLCRTPLRPNQLSVGILAIGALGAWCAAQGNHAALAVGGVLFQAQSVLDGCDGELARLTFRGSRLGEWVDTVGDDLTNYAYFGAAAVGLSRAGLGALPLALGAVGVGAGLLASGIEYVYLARIGSGDLLKYPLGFGKDPGVSEQEAREASGAKRLAGALRPLFKRDFFVFAAMLCALAGPRATLVMLALFAAGAVATLGAVLRSEWARRGVAPGQEGA